MSKTYSVSMPVKLTMRGAEDGSGNLQYIGEALPGTATSVAAWRIYKLIYSAAGNVVSILWADGDCEMDNIWDNYASLTYN